LTQHVFDKDRIERKDFEVEPTTELTTQEAARLLTIERVAFGRLPDDTTGYDIRLRVANPTDKVMKLVLEKRFFALEDAQGRAAEMIYFCCEVREAILPVGGARDVQIIFVSRREWGGKGGVSEAFVKVQGFLPIVRESWSISLPVTAE
jgi:hypothetical protein